jgi:hypothetical protein
MTTLTLNDQAPLSYPPGTAVEYIGPGHNVLNVEVRIPGARHSLFLSPKWLDWPPPARAHLRRRGLRTMRSVIG